MDGNPPMKRYGENFTNRIGDGTGRNTQDYIEIIRLLIALKAGGSFLDIGCGKGRFCKMAIPKMSEIVGIEPDFTRYDWTKNLLQRIDNCLILNMDCHEYRKENPSKRFDIVLLSEVIQHVSTRACSKLIQELHHLVKADGVIIIATSHASPKTKGFSWQKASNSESFLSREEYDKYADDFGNHTKGIPVRRFSKNELLDLVSPKFEVVLWRQFKYVKESKVNFFVAKYNVPPEEILHYGVSQFVVLQPKP